jgi:hypothetical protein
MDPPNRWYGGASILLRSLLMSIACPCRALCRWQHTHECRLGTKSLGPTVGRLNYLGSERRAIERELQVRRSLVGQVRSEMACTSRNSVERADLDVHVHGSRAQAIRDSFEFCPCPSHLVALRGPAVELALAATNCIPCGPRRRHSLVDRAFTQGYQ